MDMPLTGYRPHGARAPRAYRDGAFVSPGFHRGVLIACVMSLPVWFGGLFMVFG